MGPKELYRSGDDKFKGKMYSFFKWQWGTMRNPIAIVIISLQFIFISCNGQRTNNPNNKNVISCIALNYFGGMRVPSDTQIYYKISPTEVYKVRNIYVRKNNSILEDSIMLSKEAYKNSRVLIDSLPASILSSKEDQIGRESNSNDAPSLSILIMFSNGRKIRIYNHDISNQTKNYMDLAEKIYFKLNKE